MKVNLGYINYGKLVVYSSVILLVVALFGFLIFRSFWVTSVDKHELAFAFDVFTGKIEKIEKTGWIIRGPVRYSVHKIDLRPYQINISANSRILNAKLVRFNPEGLETFILWHGRRAGDDLSNTLEILKCYAFDRKEGTDCPFLTVVGQLSPDQGFAPAGTNIVRTLN
jgi:hypothetical protein